MTAHRLTAIARLEVLTGIGIILFWTAFFTVGLAPEHPPPGYFAFEHAFPLPDILLALALLAAARFLRAEAAARRQAGVAISLVCAGALMFLGVLDFSFNLQNGMYAISPLDTALTVLVNVWCVGVGLLIAIGCGHLVVR